MNEEDQYIAKYLNGQLQGEALAAFEDRMAKDEHFAKEVQLHKAISQGIKVYDRINFKNQFRDLEKARADENMKKKYRWLLVCLFILSIVITIIFLSISNHSKRIKDAPPTEIQSSPTDQPPGTKEDTINSRPPVATEDKKPQGNPEKEKSDQNNENLLASRLDKKVTRYIAVLSPLPAPIKGAGQLTRWQKYYQSEEYEQANSLLDSLIGAGNIGDELLFFSGLCKIHLKKYAGAQQHFDQVISNQGAYEAKALWYRSLVFHQLNQSQKARADWLKLAEEDYYYFKKEEAKELLQLR